MKTVTTAEKRPALRIIRFMVSQVRETGAGRVLTKMRRTSKFRLSLSSMSLSCLSARLSYFSQKSPAKP